MSLPPIPDVEARTRAALDALATTFTPARPTVDDLLAQHAAPVRAPVGRQPGWRPGWRAIGGAAAAIAVLAAGAAVAVRSGDDPRPVGPSLTDTAPPVTTGDAQPPATSQAPATPAPTPASTIPGASEAPSPGDPAARVVGEVPVPAGSTTVLSAFGRIWVTGAAEAVLQAIDPTTMRVERSVSFDDPIWSVTAGTDALYTCGVGGVLRLDPVTLDTTARSPQACTAAWGTPAVGHGSVWVPADGGVARLDARTLEITGHIDLGMEQPQDVVTTDDAVWVTAHGDATTPIGSFTGLVVRLDPATGEQLARIQTPGHARDALAAGGQLWVTVEPRPEHDLTGLIAIDAASNTIATTSARFPVDAARLAFTGTTIVVGSYFGPIAAVDPVDGAVTSFDPAPDAPARGRSAIAWDGTRLWNLVPATDAIGARLLAVDLAPAGPAPADPAVTARLRTPKGASGLAVDPTGQTWQVTPDGTLRALNASGRIGEEHTVPTGLTELVAAPDALFACGAGGTTRIDAATFEVTASSEPCARGIAAGDDGVWLAQGTTVAQLDPDTLTRRRRVDVAAHGGITVAFGAVWVPDGNVFGSTGFVTRIDPSPGGATERIELPSAAHFAAAHDGRLWISMWPDAGSDRTAFARIDPATNRIEGTIEHLPFDAERIVPVGDRLVVSSLAGTLAVVDPAEARVLATWRHGEPAEQADQSAIAWDGAHLWQHLSSTGTGATVVIDLGRYAPAG